MHRKAFPGQICLLQKERKLSLDPVAKIINTEEARLYSQSSKMFQTVNPIVKYLQNLAKHSALVTTSGLVEDFSVVEGETK